jgi:diaminohydroxyphosphoribosylaminopyrimidine deaminase/5-amino-6-(5-phosphoribosylamino)uracil reductase
VHDLRADSQAVVVGAGTALADHPALTVRDTLLPEIANGPAPLRVLLDARGRVPAAGPLFDGEVPTLVVTTPECAGSRQSEWADRGAEVVQVAFAGTPGSRGVDLEATLSLLGSRGVLQAMVEGGSLLHRAFLAADLADRLVLYTGNTLLGAAGAPVFGGDGPATIAGARRFTLVDVRALGDDVRIDYEPGAAA